MGSSMYNLSREFNAAKVSILLTKKILFLYINGLQIYMFNESEPTVC
jgi:hypothetical protein